MYNVYIHIYMYMYMKNSWWARKLGILEQCCFELLALTCVRSSFMHCTHRLCIVHVHVHAHCTLKLLSWVKRWSLCSLTCSSSLPNSASLSAPSSSSVLYHTVKYMDMYMYVYMHRYTCTCTCTHKQHTYVHVQYASKKSCQYRLPFHRFQFRFPRRSVLPFYRSVHRFTVHRSPFCRFTVVPFQV